MKFMMLMIPAVYQGGKPALGFTPDPKKVEEMGSVQSRNWAKRSKLNRSTACIRSAKGARVSFGKGQPLSDRRAVHRKRKKWWAATGWWKRPSKEEVVKWAQRCPADEGDTIEIRQIFGPEDFAK